MDATLDHRMFTEEGRNQIKEDILKSNMILDTIKQIAIDYKENTLSRNSSDEYRKGRASFSQNVGTNIKDYTNFALDYTNQGSISTITNVNTKNLVTSVPSVFN